MTIDLAALRALADVSTEDEFRAAVEPATVLALVEAVEAAQQAYKAGTEPPLRLTGNSWTRAPEAVLAPLEVALAPFTTEERP